MAVMGLGGKLAECVLKYLPATQGLGRWAELRGPCVVGCQEYRAP